jgi:SWI/SNF-related matrix-associated actin-dependent regulator of chromatin subfamily A-like protein 1
MQYVVSAFRRTGKTSIASSSSHCTVAINNRNVDPSLHAQADAFARLLALAPGDVDEVFRRAVALAQGLFPHQIEGVAFLLGRRRAILADDMGLGKTRQVIVALRHTAPGGPYLVVCPASVKHNWAREIAIASPSSSTHIVQGSAGGLRGHDWVVINYDILSRHVDAIGSQSWGAIVFDEAHYLKNHTSARSRLARRIAEDANRVDPKPAVYLLTGTPLTNRPRDLFVLLQLVGHPLGRSFLSFAKRYCAAERNEWGWQTGGASNLEELTVQLHGVMLRRSKDQVLALPPKLRTWLPVEVPRGTGVRDMRKVVELLVDHDRIAPQSDISEWQLRGRLLAAVTRARQAVAEVKVKATIDLAAGAIDQGEKVIVFSCYEGPMEKLARHFGETAVVLTGKTPGEKRLQLVDRFQNDAGVRVFLANIIAGGIGTNLTAATQVVFNDLDWVPANHWQAEDRAYRIGQTRTVNVTYMIASNTIDDFVQSVLEKKAALVTAVVDGTAMAPDVAGDVLDELRRALRTISSGLTDAVGDDALVERLIAQARLEIEAAATTGVGELARAPEEVDALRRALDALAKALSPPPLERYRFASASHPGIEYEITVDGADVVCSCPGFEYRGQCRHAREIKATAGAGAIPDGYRRSTPA